MLGALLSGVTPGVTLAQAPRQPANMTTTPVTPLPHQSLQVLDPTGTWVPVGTINPTDHSFSGGAGGGYQYETHAALIAAVTTAPATPQAIGQQGFYVAGDGGAAIYQWSATSTCTGGTPTDDIVCIAPGHPAPYSSGTPGRYLLQIGQGIDVRQVGMQPGGYGGFDNAPIVPTLMLALNPAGLPLQGATTTDINFPAVPGQVHTDYYFSKSFHMSRRANIVCPGNSSGGGDSGTRLVFEDGVHGIIFDNNTTSPDGIIGGGAIRGCGVVDTSRYGAQSITSGSAAITGVNFAQGWPIPGSVWQWGAGDGVIIYPVFQPPSGAPAVASGAYIASANAGAQTITLASPFVSNTTTSGTMWRLPAADKFTINTLNGAPTFMITSGPNTLLTTGDYIWSDAWPLGTNVMGTHASSLFTETSTNNFNVGDALTIGNSTYHFVSALGSTPGNVLRGANFAASAANLVSATNSGVNGGLITAHITGTTLTVEVFQYGSTIHAGQQVAGAAPGTSIVSGFGSTWTVTPSQTVAPGTTLTTSWYAADYTGYIAGTTLNISSLASGTVAIGQYVIGAAPGTLITGGSGSTWTVNNSQTLGSVGSPVALNSGSYVPTVGASSVSALWNEFPATATTINFTASWASPQARSYPSTYTPAGTAAGSFQAGTFTNATGQMTDFAGLNGATVIPATKTEIGGQMWLIPAAVKVMVGVSLHNNYISLFPIGLEMACGGIDPFTGCDAIVSQENVFSSSIIGRLAVGDNTSGSTSIGNIYAYASFADIAEMGIIGSTYIGENSNSAEDSSSIYGAVGLCNGVIKSTFITGYIATNGATDGYCVSGWGTGASPGGTIMWIGAQSGAPPGAPQIANASITGAWRLSGGGGTICLSATDIIEFVAGSDCTYAWSFGDGGSGEYSWRWFGGIGGSPMWWTTGAAGGYTGYLANNLAFVDFHQGFLLYDAESGSFTPGPERLVDAGASIPTAAYHKQGDIHFNQSAVPGGFGAWIDTGAGASF